MQQLIEKPHFDERHEAPLLLHSGIPGIRTALRDTSKATQEVIKEVTAHGVNEITIERDSSGRIVKSALSLKVTKLAFLMVQRSRQLFYQALFQTMMQEQK